jgi:glycerol-3-phosphate dehydrogenase
MSTDLDTRRQVIDGLQRDARVPILIVGGGINGVGLLRELALQGVDALLVEKGDFCSGASAAPSRMIHGGLRYLEHGEFRLVRESLEERNRLLRNAPHCVQPLPTTIPIFAWLSGIGSSLRKFLGLGSRPSQRGALIIKAGLTLYDLLARRRRMMPGHSFTSAARSLAARPRLNPAIVCTATYYDAWITMPERLGLELVLDAAALHSGARALNYASLVGGEQDTVFIRDELSGETLAVRPGVLINATGAWIDLTNQALRRNTRLIGGTKGSHLILRHAELHAATAGHMLYYENRDGRICILFPFFDRVLAGSTDIRVDDPDTAVCDEAEVDYILDSVRHVFPDVRVDRSHIVFRFCGVRPLGWSRAAAGDISRDSDCVVIEPAGGIEFPIYAMVGGKWTTFRAFAARAADRALERLERPRVAASDDLAIGGGRDFPTSEAGRAAWVARVEAETGVPANRLRVLLARYGTRAEAIATFLADGPDAPLAAHPAYSRREIEHLARCERVIHLEDLVLRRTALALAGEVTRELVDELAGILARVQGWPPERTASEVQHTRALLRDRHGVALPEAVAPLPA